MLQALHTVESDVRVATIYVQYTEVHRSVHSSLSTALLRRTYVQLQVSSEEVEAITYGLSFLGKIVGKHFQIFFLTWLAHTDSLALAAYGTF